MDEYDCGLPAVLPLGDLSPVDLRDLGLIDRRENTCFKPLRTAGGCRAAHRHVLSPHSVIVFILLRAFSARAISNPEILFQRFSEVSDA